MKYLLLIYINEMNKPNFNPNTMDIFTKRGREKFDQYMKEKKQWEVVYDLRNNLHSIGSVGSLGNI